MGPVSSMYWEGSWPKGIQNQWLLNTWCQPALLRVPTGNRWRALIKENLGRVYFQKDSRQSRVWGESWEKLQGSEASDSIAFIPLGQKQGWREEVTSSDTESYVEQRWPHSEEAGEQTSASLSAPSLLLASHSLNPTGTVAVDFSTWTSQCSSVSFKPLFLGRL